MPMFLQLRQLRCRFNALAQNGVCRRNFGVVNQFNSARMNRDEDPQLWDLLGRASGPRISPFFARNVARRVRAESESRGSRASWLLWRVLVPTSAAALLALSATIFIRNSPSRHAQPLPGVADSWPAISEQSVTAEPDSSEAILAQIDQQDYDVVQNLDDLMVMYETSLWDENSRL